MTSHSEADLLVRRLSMTARRLSMAKRESCTMVGRLQTPTCVVMFGVFVRFAAISLIDLRTLLFAYHKILPLHSTDVMAPIRGRSEQSVRRACSIGSRSESQSDQFGGCRRNGEGATFSSTRCYFWRASRTLWRGRVPRHLDTCDPHSR